MREIVVNLARSFTKGAKNSKVTTVSGWALAVAAIGTEAADYFDLDPTTIFEPRVIAGAVAVAVIATFARDNDKSSEEAAA